MQKIKEYCLTHLQQVGIIGGAILILLSWGYSRVNHQISPQMASSNQVHQETSRSTTSTRTAGSICIDIKGAVNRPGVYHLAKGSRVEEAIAAAGGSTGEADLNQVNLAKELVDQQVIQVPKIGEKAGTLGNTSSVGSDEEKININTATKEELTKIEGVGDKKAEKIIEYRTQHGGFNAPEDLKNISGFGEKTVAKLKDKLAV